MNIASVLANKVKSVKLPIPKKFAVKLEKHAPDIMVGTGIVLVVGSAVYACKKTIEAKDIVEDAATKISDINFGEDIADGDSGFNKVVARKERMKVYRDTAIYLGKCYGPSIVGGIAGITLILGAHKMEKDRNAALGMAYANLLASYQSYRDRVKEEIGEDKEFYIYSGASKKDIEVAGEDGKIEKYDDATVFHDDGSGHSMYARIFDEYNINWEKSASANLTFLKSIQNEANDKLQAEGVVFLNDVYYALGFPRTSEGQLVGWVKNGNGDNYIDFGIFDNAFSDIKVRDFINGWERCIWLDFNVDGVVYDLI